MKAVIMAIIRIKIAIETGFGIDNDADAKVERVESIMVSIYKLDGEFYL